MSVCGRGAYIHRAVLLWVADTERTGVCGRYPRGEGRIESVTASACAAVPSSSWLDPTLQLDAAPRGA